MKCNKITIVLFIFILGACASSERVITQDGKIYEVKGEAYFQNGKNVTEHLSSKDKAHISNVLENRLESERSLKREQTALKAEQDYVKQTLKEAEKKQKALENKQKRIEKGIKKKEAARERVLKVKARLNKNKEKYQKLEAKKKLSTRNKEKWERRFERDEKDLIKALKAFEN
ncbi:hypothetical protein ACFFU9_01735 [Mariniflexile ostreae]|uniref:Uncharacterized protein n=1 Tax=Mariniflexile ostreae TaxID=1520892 RepID=A0ABV5F7L2_9FLAO